MFADNNSGGSNGDPPGDPDVFVFKATSHATSLLASVHSLREHNGLCDVALQAEGTEIHAHKVILAAGSPYFHAMFSNHHRETFANRISIIGIDGPTLGILVSFIYSSSLEITDSNVQSLLAGASLIQLQSVVDGCCRYLQARVCAENCLGIAAFADQHGCTELHRFAWTFAVENFAEVIVGEEFLAMPPHLVTEYVRCEELQVCCEEEVLDCILLWLKHDERGRGQVVMAALKQVKIPLIPWKFLQERFRQVACLSSNPLCQSYVEEAKTHQTCSASPKPYSEIFTISQYIPRRSVGRNTFIYAVGGETSPGRTTTSSMERWDPAKNSWETLASMTTCRRGVGVGILNGCLYAVGGSDGIQPLKLAERYDPSSDIWTQIADMNEKRSSVAVATLGEHFYAVGGYTRTTSCLQSVEQYNPTTDVWSYIPSMVVPRSMACACSMGGRIYVVGGYNGMSDLQSCEVFNPDRGAWELIEEMKTKRCMANVTSLDGKLYVAGGCDNTVSLKSVESFDPATGKWSPLSDMSEARSGLGLAVIGHKLFAMGGHNGRGSSGYCTTVEQYSTTTDTWTIVANVTTGRRRFGCCS